MKNIAKKGKVALYRKGIGDQYVIQSISIDTFTGVVVLVGNWGREWETLKISAKLAVDSGLINPDAIFNIIDKRKTL